MLSVKEAKQITNESLNRLDYIIDEITSGRMFSEEIIRNNIIELIQLERIDAATLAIDKFYT